jgi:hypothetical protein
MAPYKGSLCPCFLSPWFLRVVMQYFGNELGNCLATWEIRLMMILTCNRKCRLTLPQARYCMTCQGHLILLFSTCTWSVNISTSHGPLQRQLVSLLSVALVLESGHAVSWKWAWQLLGHLRDQSNASHGWTPMEGYAGQMIRGLDKIYSIYNVILVPHNFLVIDDYIFFEKKKYDNHFEVVHGRFWNGFWKLSYPPFILNIRKNGKEVGHALDMTKTKMIQWGVQYDWGIIPIKAPLLMVESC